jgi:tetratricopeptide (TPR) repeat protein
MKSVESKNTKWKSMKKVVFLLSILFTNIWGFALEIPQWELQAEQAYASGKYQEAIDQYQQILKAGMESVNLYYNLGNCYYKLGDNTKAILNYERALLLEPGDEMVRYNLKMAQQAIVDKIEILPELFFVRWYKSLITTYSADQWGYFSVGLFIIFLLMAGLFFYSRTQGMKKTGFVVGIVAFFLTLTTILFAYQQDQRISNREYAIITTPSVTVKGAPDASGTSLFLIHEGLKVQLLEELGDWYNIRLADGNEGWVARTDLEKI